MEMDDLDSLGSTRSSLGGLVFAQRSVSVGGLTLKRTDWLNSLCSGPGPGDICLSIEHTHSNPLTPILRFVRSWSIQEDVTKTGQYHRIVPFGQRVEFVQACRGHFRECDPYKHERSV